MALREFVRLDHDAMPPAGRVQPGALAEPDQHCRVCLLPGVVFRDVMPAHAGDGGALRRTWKAALVTTSSKRAYILKAKWALSVERPPGRAKPKQQPFIRRQKDGLPRPLRSSAH